MACPHVAAVAARCYRAGACNSETGSEMHRVLKLARTYNEAHPEYGFAGDPSRPAAGARVYGYMVYGNKW
jgi:hypothetical protein